MRQSKTDEQQLDPPYDAIFSSHVLEHFPNPAKALKNIRGWLREGGVFVSFNPNGSTQQLPAARRVFDNHWERLHPVHLDENFLSTTLSDIPVFLTSRGYGRWNELLELNSWDRSTSLVGDLTRPELLTIFINSAVHCE